VTKRRLRGEAKPNQAKHRQIAFHRRIRARGQTIQRDHQPQAVASTPILSTILSRRTPCQTLGRKTEETALRFLPPDFDVPELLATGQGL
jgi:hypothetical protein